VFAKQFSNNNKKLPPHVANVPSLEEGPTLGQKGPTFCSTPNAHKQNPKARHTQHKVRHPGVQPEIMGRDALRAPRPTFSASTEGCRTFSACVGPSHFDCVRCVCCKMSDLFAPMSDLLPVRVGSSDQTNGSQREKWRCSGRAAAGSTTLSCRLHICCT
jgi:hypothetical protein